MNCQRGKSAVLEAVNLVDKISQFQDKWSPKIVCDFNDYDIMVVRVEGEFVWHSHPDTDDFFMVLEGRLDIELKEGSVTLLPGEIYVVPRGIEHRPTALYGETKLMLIEPKGTPNTGDCKTASKKVAL